MLNYLIKFYSGIRYRFQRYVFIKQHDSTDCAAACLAMAAQFYGFKTTITKIRDIAGTDKLGTNVFGVIKAAEALGFTAKGIKGDEESFFSGFPLPAIAHVIIDNTMLHYIIIYSINEKEVVVSDPARGIRTYTTEGFFSIWTGYLILLIPMDPFKKGNEAKGLFARYRGILFEQKKFLLGIFFISLIYTLLGIAGSFYFKFLIDEVLVGGLKRTLHVFSIGFLLLNICKILLDAFRTQLLLHLSRKMDTLLMLGYYRHILELPVKFFGTRRVGELISRFSDAAHIRDAISSAALTVMIDTLMVLAGGLILYTQSPVLFVIALITSIAYGLMVIFFNKTLKKNDQEQMEDNAQLTSHLVETVNGIETIKAYNAEKQIYSIAETKFNQLLSSVLKGGRILNFQSSMAEFIAITGEILILWIGSIYIMEGKMSVGQLLTFNALLIFFLDPIRNLIGIQPKLQNAVVASDRLGEILDLESEKDEAEDKKNTPEDIRGLIEFKNVDFRYGSRQLVLKDINITIEQGEKVALVGESGSGKTTLAKLLLKFYTPERGEIIINGCKLGDLNIEKLRERISYVPQEHFLFSGSIKDNLCLGNSEVDIDEIIEIAKKTKAHEFIKNLIKEYDSPLDENGGNLSGGQKQMLVITRAALKNADILILDEATSNLDSITEKAIEMTLNEVTLGITTLVIAHRLSTAMICDRIFVLDKGAIVESGTHEELIIKRGKYYKLWQGQMLKRRPYDPLPAK